MTLPSHRHKCIPRSVIVAALPRSGPDHPTTPTARSAGTTTDALKCCSLMLLRFIDTWPPLCPMVSESDRRALTRSIHLRVGLPNGHACSSICSAVRSSLTPNVAFSRGRACRPGLECYNSPEHLLFKGRNASVIRRLQRLVRHACLLC